MKFVYLSKGFQNFSNSYSKVQNQKEKNALNRINSVIYI